MWEILERQFLLQASPGAVTGLPQFPKQRFLLQLPFSGHSIYLALRLAFWVLDVDVASISVCGTAGMFSDPVNRRCSEGKHRTLKSQMLWDDHWKRRRRHLVQRHVPQELNPTAPYPEQVLPTITVASGPP